MSIAPGEHQPGYLYLALAYVRIATRINACSYTEELFATSRRGSFDFLFTGQQQSASSQVGRRGELSYATFVFFAARDMACASVFLADQQSNMASESTSVSAD